MNKLANREIGYRAAEFVYSYSRLYELPVKNAMKRFGLDRKLVSAWARGDAVPSAFSLQALCLAGADVRWILTGAKSG